MQIDLKDQQLQEIVAAAIFQSIDKDKRDILVKDAIKHLLTPVSINSNWNAKQESPLQTAFNMQVQTVASLIIREELEQDDTFKQNIRTLLVEASEKMLGEKRGELVDNLATQMGKGISYWRE